MTISKTTKIINLMSVWTWLWTHDLETENSDIFTASVSAKLNNNLRTILSYCAYTIYTKIITYVTLKVNQP